MRGLRYAAYAVLFLFSFALFLYWGFPYDSLKDRVAVTLRDQLGGKGEVTINNLSPYYFTGLSLKGLSINTRDGGTPQPAFTVDSLTVRATMFSLLFGRPRYNFSVKMGKGDLSGSFNSNDGLLNIDATCEDLDISALALLQSQYGLKLSSKINGDVVLRYDQQRVTRSTGSIDLSIPQLALAESTLTIIEGGIPLPAIVLSKSRNSHVKASLSQGTVSIDKFSLEGGDLGLNLSGKIFLSTDTESHRLNLTGTFTASPQLVQALPFLFLVEKQKQADGSYPISITGRLSRPNIKVGTFTLPL